MPWTARSTVEGSCSTLKLSESTTSLIGIVAGVRCDRQRSVSGAFRMDGSLVLDVAARIWSETKTIAIGCQAR
jgi:hypothetical protein